MRAQLADAIARRWLVVLSKKAAAVMIDDRHRAIEDRIAKACDVVRRSIWGALPVRKHLEADWNYNSIVVRYSGHGDLTSMRKIQDFDYSSSRAWDDISYHYGIAMDGKIFEGRELVFKGSHLKLHNTGQDRDRLHGRFRRELEESTPRHVMERRQGAACRATIAAQAEPDPHHGLPDRVLRRTPGVWQDGNLPGQQPVARGAHDARRAEDEDAGVP